MKGVCEMTQKELLNLYLVLLETQKHALENNTLFDGDAAAIVFKYLFRWGYPAKGYELRFVPFDGGNPRYKIQL